MSVVKQGPGTLKYLFAGSYEVRDKPFKYHMTMGTGGYALDGCVMATWEPGTQVQFEVHGQHSESDEGSTESTTE